MPGNHLAASCRPSRIVILIGAAECALYAWGGADRLPALPCAAVTTDTHSIRRFGYRQELRRSLSFADMLVYGLIYMVPIAPFGFFGAIYASSGGMVALTYALGMVVMMITAASYGQMARAFPMAGSVYTYAGHGIAPSVGFFTGWMVLLDYVLVPSMLYLGAGLAMHSLLPRVPVMVWLVVFLALNTVVNCTGIKLTALVTRLMLIGEAVVLAIFLAVGIGAVAIGREHATSSWHAVYNGQTFSWPLLFGAVSIAALSFLGFDAIAMLAEENRGHARQIGRAMVIALLLTGAVFVAQSWLASLFVPDPAELLHGDPNGTAFYDAAGVAGGGWLSRLTAIATGLSWGIPTTLVAQVSTSRLLYAMARDRQLPGFLARVSPKRLVPTNAILASAGIALVVGVGMSVRDDGMTLLSNMINFGAMSAFLILHVAVIAHYTIRNHSRRVVPHLIVPLLGLGTLLYVMINAKVAAQLLGVVWAGLGLVVLAGLHAAGRRPRIPDLLAAGQDLA